MLLACSLVIAHSREVRGVYRAKEGIGGGTWRDFSFFFYCFFIRGDTRSLRMPAVKPASQAGPMCNSREGTSVVLRDTIRLT